MHPIIEYLRTNSVESLEQLGIYCYRSKTNPMKFGLNYDQIEAKDGDPLVNLCRGLVLREPHAPGEDHVIYARPFPRFYNYGSGHAADIDWSTAVFEEKLDGTCCIVYYDHDLKTWCIGTRSVPDADVVSHNGLTFAEMFWRVCPERVKSSFEIGRTYVFELTGPENQIVIPYEEWSITLLASFDNSTGEETSGDAKTYAFESYDEASRWLSAQPGHTFEGFVVRDSNYNRVKVKSKDYLALGKVMTSSSSDFGLLSIFLSGSADDVKIFLPKAKCQRLDEISQKTISFFHELENYSNSIPTEYSRKEAALMITSSKYKSWIGLILDIKFGKYKNVNEFLVDSRNRNMNPGYLPKNIIEKILNEIGQIVTYEFVWTLNGKPIVESVADDETLPSFKNYLKKDK